MSALELFRSDANVTRVVQLLADRDYVVVTSNDGPRMRRVLVRARAHEVLGRWRVPHATPVVEEPAP